MRLSIPFVELYVVLILSKSREQSTLGVLPGNYILRIMIQHNAVGHFYLGTMNTDLNFAIFGQMSIYSVWASTFSSLFKFRRRIRSPNTF